MGIIFRIIAFIILCRIAIAIISFIVRSIRRMVRNSSSGRRDVVRDSVSSRTDLGRSQPRRTPSAGTAAPSVPTNDRRFIRQTGEIIYFANDRHNSSDTLFTFNYCQLPDNSWRAYITSMPSLNGRPSSGTITHRLWDGENKPYVCWNTDLYALSDIQNVSKFWADCIVEYIATGKKFG